MRMILEKGKHNGLNSLISDYSFPLLLLQPLTFLSTFVFAFLFHNKTICISRVLKTSFISLRFHLFKENNDLHNFGSLFLYVELCIEIMFFKEIVEDKLLMVLQACSKADYKFHRMNYFSFLLTTSKSEFILVNKYIMQKSNKNMI